MRALLLIVLCAAIAFAQSQTVTIKKYEKFDCTGPVEHNYTVPTGQCIPGNGDRNINSLKFSCAASSGACAVIYPNSEPNCEHKIHKVDVPCNQCIQGPPEVGHYKYICSTLSKTVKASMKCDETCKTCEHTGEMTVGQCHKYGKDGNHTVYLEKIAKCPGEILEQTWDKTGCAGTETDYHLFEGRCEAGWMFECTAGLPMPILGKKEMPHHAHMIKKQHPFWH